MKHHENRTKQVPTLNRMLWHTALGNGPLREHLMSMRFILLLGGLPWGESTNISLPSLKMKSIFLFSLAGFSDHLGARRNDVNSQSV